MSVYITFLFPSFLFQFLSILRLSWQLPGYYSTHHVGGDTLYSGTVRVTSNAALQTGSSQIDIATALGEKYCACEKHYLYQAIISATHKSSLTPSPKKYGLVHTVLYMCVISRKPGNQ